MNIFKNLNYRETLVALIEERRKGDRHRWSFQELAEAMRVPKSYMSRVIHGNADLSHDQLYLACEYLGLTNDEAAFLDLLLQYERCALEKRRVRLRVEIRQAQARFLDTAKQLNSVAPVDEIPIQSEFYINPLYQFVHAALSIPRFQDDPLLIAPALCISREQVIDVIHRLERMGLCERKGGRAIAIEVNFHLPKTSPIAAAWQNQMRLLAMQRMQLLPRDEYYSYSVIFSADKATDQEIRQKFLEFLKSAQSAASGSAVERTYQLNFDLIPWA